MSTPQRVLDLGESNLFWTVAKKLGLGTLLFGKASSGLSVVVEDLPVASNAAAPTYIPLEVLECCVYGGSAGNGGKKKLAPGDSTAAKSVTLDGTTAALSFFAGEVTGAGARVRVKYLTAETTAKKSSTGSGDYVPLTASDDTSMGYLG